MPVEVESIVLHPQLAASGGVEIIVGLLVTSGWGAGMGYKYGGKRRVREDVSDMDMNAISQSIRSRSDVHSPSTSTSHGRHRPSLRTT